MQKRKPGQPHKGWKKAAQTRHRRGQQILDAQREMQQRDSRPSEVIAREIRDNWNED